MSNPPDRYTAEGQDGRRVVRYDSFLAADHPDGELVLTEEAARERAQRLCLELSPGGVVVLFRWPGREMPAGATFAEDFAFLTSHVSPPAPETVDAWVRTSVGAIEVGFLAARAWVRKGYLLPEIADALLAIEELS